MWLHIKCQLFEGAQDVFSRLMAVCCMLLPHNPCWLSQHYKRQVCEPYCSCKHWYLWISPNLSISFVWIIWVQYATDNCSVHKPVLLFQPTVNCRASDIQRWAVPRAASLTERTAQLLCVDIWLRFFGGVWEVEEVHSSYTEKPWPSWVRQLTRTVLYFR
jgi:hypothetical protein